MKNWINTSFTTGVDGANIPDFGGAETNDSVQYSVMDKGDGTCLTRVTADTTTMDTITSASTTTVFTDSQAKSALYDHRPQAFPENLDVPDIEVTNTLNTLSIGRILTKDEQTQARLILRWSRDLTHAEQAAILYQHDAISVPEVVTTTTPTQQREIIDSYSINTVPAHIDTATAARCVIQSPSVGTQVLQDQELTAMMKIAKAKGREKADELSQNTRSNTDGGLNDHAKAILQGKQTEHGEFLEYMKGNRSPPWNSTASAHANGRP